MKTLAAGTVTVCLSVTTATLLAICAGALNTPIAVAALGIGAAAGVLAFRSCERDPIPPIRGVATWGAVLLFVLFASRAFLWLVFKTDDEVRVLSPNNLGDLSLHLTYIRHVAAGARFWPDNPIFAGTPLHYPLGVDLWNALLVRCGADVYRSLIWAGLAGSVATGWALYRWGGGFALAGFLCNGGFAAWEIFTTGELRDFQAELAWKSLPLAMFVTQRGLLYALPAGLLLLASWRARLGDAGSRKALPFWIELALYGTMPLFHFHTFLALSLLLGCWVFYKKAAIKLLACAFVPATALTILVTGMFAHDDTPKQLRDFAGDVPRGWIEAVQLELNHRLAEHGSPIWLKLRWMQGDEGFLKFWALNFGLLPIAVAALCFAIARNRHTGAALFVWPAVGLFGLCCVVMFAPWEWDNTKLMIWAYLLVLPFLWENLLRPRHIAIRSAACVALFFSGFLSLLGGLDASHDGHEIGKRSELESLENTLAALPPDAICAGQPTWNHPLLLAGRKMPLGYEGHLWSHGIPYRDRLDEFERFMNGGADWRAIAEELAIRYVFWGEREKTAYPHSTQPWRAEASLVTSGGFAEIYDLQPPRR